MCASRTNASPMARILIIDDDAAVRMTIAAALRRQGHDVREASDGREGLLRFGEAAVDLVITDIVMPDKEGIETIMELRQLAPGIPIIAMSGSGDSDLYLGMAARLGAAFTLSKPCSAERLIEVVNRALPTPPAPPASPKVLVVDDDPNGRFLTIHRLRREFPTLSIVEAENANIALDTVNQTAIDAVITDNGIGLMDGVTMIRELRARHFAKPIIMASMNPTLERKALAAGANAFVYSGDDAELIRVLKTELNADPA